MKQLHAFLYALTRMYMALHAQGDFQLEEYQCGIPWAIASNQRPLLKSQKMVKLP